MYMCNVDSALTDSFHFKNFQDDFSMNPTTGVVSVAKQLDRETIQQYTLVVKAEDQGTNVNSR